MQVVLPRRFFLITFLILVNVWWIFSILFICTSEKELNETIPNGNDEYEIIRRNRIQGFGKTRYIQTEKISLDSTIENAKAHPLDINNIQIDKMSDSYSTEDLETFPLDINYIPESISTKKNEELHELHEDEEHCLDELKTMLQIAVFSKDVEFEEDFLKLYIKDTKCDIDLACKKIQNLLKLEKNHGYFFRNIDFDFTQNPAYRFSTLLPHRRKDGSVTILFEAAKWNPEEVSFEEMKQYMFMMYVQELRNPITQASGFNFICDFQNAGFQYVRYSTPGNVFLVNHILHEVLPTFFVGIHLVNVNFLGSLLLALSRPFLPEFIKKILYVHSSLDELKDYYPLSMLPVQYGGTLEHYYVTDWLINANAQHGNFTVAGQKNTF